MAMSRPVLVSSPAFRDLIASSPLPLGFPWGDPESLTCRIEALANAPSTQLTAIGDALSSRVRAEHSLEHWADRVAHLVTELGR
jgi:hypothetical protein